MGRRVWADNSIEEGQFSEGKFAGYRRSITMQKRIIEDNAAYRKVINKNHFSVCEKTEETEGIYEGKIAWDFGKTYAGLMDIWESPHGLGRMVEANGVVKEGRWLRGKLQR